MANDPTLDTPLRVKINSLFRYAYDKYPELTKLAYELADEGLRGIYAFSQDLDLDIVISNEHRVAARWTAFQMLGNKSEGLRNHAVQYLAKRPFEKSAVDEKGSSATVETTDNERIKETGEIMRLLLGVDGLRRSHNPRVISGIETVIAELVSNPRGGQGVLNHFILADLSAREDKNVDRNLAFRVSLMKNLENICLL